MKDYYNLFNPLLVVGIQKMSHPGLKDETIHHDVATTLTLLEKEHNKLQIDLESTGDVLFDASKFKKDSFTCLLVNTTNVAREITFTGWTGVYARNGLDALDIKANPFVFKKNTQVWVTITIEGVNKYLNIFNDADPAFKAQTIHHNTPLVLPLTELAHKNSEIHIESTGGVSLDAAQFVSDNGLMYIVNDTDVAVGMTFSNWTEVYNRNKNLKVDIKGIVHSIARNSMVMLSVTVEGANKQLNILDSIDESLKTETIHHIATSNLDITEALHDKKEIHIESTGDLSFDAASFVGDVFTCIVVNTTAIDRNFTFTNWTGVYNRAGGAVTDIKATGYIIKANSSVIITVTINGANKYLNIHSERYVPPVSAATDNLMLQWRSSLNPVTAGNATHAATLQNSAAWNAGGFVRLTPGTGSFINGQMEYTLSPTSSMIRMRAEVKFPNSPTVYGDGIYLYSHCTSTPSAPTSTAMGGYSFRLDTGTNFLRILFNGVELASASMFLTASGNPFANGNWSTFEAEVNGRVLSMYVNGVLVLRFVDVVRTLTGELCGVGGIEGYINSGATDVRNFEVWKTSLEREDFSNDIPTVFNVNSDLNINSTSSAVLNKRIIHVEQAANLRTFSLLDGGGDFPIGFTLSINCISTNGCRVIFPTSDNVRLGGLIAADNMVYDMIVGEQITIEVPNSFGGAGNWMVTSNIPRLIPNNRVLQWTSEANPTIAGNATHITTFNGTTTWNASNFVRLTDTSGSDSGQMNYRINPGDAIRIYGRIRIGSAAGADAMYFYAYNTSIPTSEGDANGGYSLAFNEWTGAIQLRYNGSIITSDVGEAWADGNWHNIEWYIEGNMHTIVIDGTIKFIVRDTWGRDLSGTFIGVGARTGGTATTHDIVQYAIWQSNGFNVG